VKKALNTEFQGFAIKNPTQLTSGIQYKIILPKPIHLAYFLLNAPNNRLANSYNYWEQLLVPLSY
jgi:hypothetical protein